MSVSLNFHTKVKPFIALIFNIQGEIKTKVKK